MKHKNFKHSLAVPLNLIVFAIGISMFLLISKPTLADSIPIDDSNIVWSPYTWVENGSTWKQSPTTGAYIDIAFSGTTLGLNVDSSFVTSPAAPANLIIRAFIDGNSIPITRTLADVSSGQLLFSNSLSNANHYAHIVITKNSNNSSRWAQTAGTPRSTLRVTSFELASGASTQSLTTTPLAKNGPKILYYGDSITEGNGIGGVTFGESSHAAIVGRELNADYGLHGYGSLTWYFSAFSSAPDFHFPSSNGSYATATWRNYYEGTSLLNNAADPSSGYVEGTPDAIFNNVGINDVSMYGIAPPFGGLTAITAFEERIAEWLAESREAIGARPAIFMVMPFNYNCTQAINPALSLSDISNYQLYRQTYIDTINEYITNTQDNRVFIIDLGEEGCEIVYLNSSDTLHPNPAASETLGIMVAAQAEQEIILNTPLSALFDTHEVSSATELTSQPDISGTAPAGSNITVTVTPGSHSCSATANSSGDWSCALSTLDEAGNYSFTVTAETTYNETLTFGPFAVTVSGANGSELSGGSIENQPESTLAKSGLNLYVIALSSFVLTVTALYMFNRYKSSIKIT